MSGLMLDVGLANELKLAFRRSGYDTDEIKRLCEGDTLVQFRKVLLGGAVITVPENLVDLNADPFVPSDLKVEEHTKAGQFKWDASKVTLFLSEPQKRGRAIGGNKLRKTLKGQNAYNVNLLDYLLKNPHLIPEEWKGKYVFFWGTIYRCRDGNLYVRYGYSFDGVYRSHYRWLDHDWDDNYPAAVLAS